MERETRESATYKFTDGSVADSRGGHTSGCKGLNKSFTCFISSSLRFFAGGGSDESNPSRPSSGLNRRKDSSDSSSKRPVGSQVSLPSSMLRSPQQANEQKRKASGRSVKEMSGLADGLLEMKSDQVTLEEGDEAPALQMEGQDIEGK